MNKHADHSFFKKFSQNGPSKRRLALETLENRMMLSATEWSGFQDAVLNTYQTSGGQFDFDLVRSADLCQFADMDGDGVEELITWNYAAKTADVYKNQEGLFSLMNSTTGFSTASGFGIQLGDVTNDGLLDVLSVYSSPTNSKNLILKVYAGQSDGSFVTANTSVLTSTLYLSCFSSISSATSFSASDVSVQLTSEADLVLNVNGLNLTSSSFAYFTGIGKYTNRGTGLFTSAGTEISSSTNSTGIISTSLACTATINQYNAGTWTSLEWIVRNNTSSGELNFFKTNGTSTVLNSPVFSYRSATEVNGVNLSGLSLNWTISPMANVLVSGGTMSDGTKGILVSTLNFQSTTALASCEWVEVDDLSSMNIPAGFGDLNNDQVPELFMTDSQGFVLMTGTNKTVTFSVAGKVISVNTCTFTPSPKSILTPNYHSSIVVDLDNDGTSDLLAVGDEYIWFLKGNGDGSYAAPQVISSSFDVSVNKAVFGDFDGDQEMEIAVLAGNKTSVYGGTAVYVYDFSATDMTFFKRFSITLSQTTGDSAIPAPVDLVAGQFTQTTFSELAILTLGTNKNQSVQIFQPFSSSSTPVCSASLGGVSAASLVAGKLYDSRYDDLVTLNTTAASVTILKNSGSKTFSMQTVSVKTSSLTVPQSQPVALTIGDINGDSSSDLVFLNKNTLTSKAYVGYLLQNASADFSSASPLVNMTSTYAISGIGSLSMALEDFDGDSTLDVLVSQSLSDASSLYFFSGKGTGTGFLFNAKETLKTGIGVSMAGGSSMTVGNVNNPHDSSRDVVLVGGKVVAALLNSQSQSNTKGTVEILCQNADQVATDYNTSLQNARTWIDEWSNFYLEVWAKVDSSTNLSSFSVSLDYDSSYFTVLSNLTVAGSGFTLTGIDTSVANVVTITGTSSSSNAGEMVLLARIRMTPEGTVGVAIPQDGVFASVAHGFGLTQENVTLNGFHAKTITVPSSSALPLYPVQFDVDDSGAVSIDDYGRLASYYSKTVSATENAFGRIFDTDLDGQITPVDYQEFQAAYAKSVNSTSNAFHTVDPVVYVPTSIVSQSTPVEPETFASGSENIQENLGTTASAVYEISATNQLVSVADVNTTVVPSGIFAVASGQKAFSVGTVVLKNSLLTKTVVNTSWGNVPSQNAPGQAVWALLVADPMNLNVEDHESLDENFDAQACELLALDASDPRNQAVVDVADEGFDAEWGLEESSLPVQADDSSLVDEDPLNESLETTI